MRSVDRTVTRIHQPRPPWEWRGESPTRAPRTLLTHHRDPVLVRSGSGVFRAGTFDWCLRLYQHTGVSERSAVQDGYVLYGPEEQVLIRRRANWLEYVDNQREIVFRISKKESITLYRYFDTADGPRMGVPLDAYQRHERD